MKKLIILGGNNSRNIEWLKKMKCTYKKEYDVLTMYYDSWIDNSSIDFNVELVKLQELVKNMKDYIIIAKSAGSILSLMGICNKMIIPKAIIIMGLPLVFAENNDINLEYMLEKVKQLCKVLIIQQKNDPLGKSSDVRKILSDGIKLEQINGNYHWYGKYEEIKLIIDGFINNEIK